MRPLLLVIALMMAVPAFAAEAVVRLGPNVALDDAGLALRRALTAWEAAADEPLAANWETVVLPLSAGRLVTGPGEFLMTAGLQEGRLRLLHAGEDSLQTTLVPGDQVRMGPAEVWLLIVDAQRDRATVLVRAINPPPMLRDPRPDATHAVRIEGAENPNRLRIVAEDRRAVAFAEAMVEGLNRGQTDEAAAREAFRQIPPRSAATRQPIEIETPTRFPLEAAEAPMSDVMVTLSIVRGESSALRALSSSGSYDSSGASPSRPRVGVSAGGAGGRIEVGSPSDRFRGTLSALEREGRAQSESEVFVRVPLNGQAGFRMQRGGSFLTGTVFARRVGNDVELQVRQSGGDWSGFGAVSTRVRLGNGQTRLLAQSSATRTSQTRSGPPIVGQIPYVGGMVGSSTSSRESWSTAMMATVSY